MVMRPRATASRDVIAFSPTSTIWMAPDGLTCDKRVRRSGMRLDRFATDLGIEVSLREEKRQALERDRQVDALQLDVRWDVQRSGREVEHRLDPCQDHSIDDGLCGCRWHRDHRD